MDMSLSKRGDYVMRSAISLSRNYDSGAPRKIREVVAETAVPQTFASQILADLVRAGLATSKAGRTGGYRLARSPSEISVLEVIEAAEGPLRAERCALGEGPCRWSAVCPLHETWSAATAALRELLAKTTLAEVAARDVAIEAGTYTVPPDSHRTHPVAVDLTDAVQVELGAPEVHAALTRLGADLADLVAAADLGRPATPRAPRRRAPAGAVEASLVPVGTGSAKMRNDATGPNGAHGVPAADAPSYLLGWRLLGPDPTSWLEASLTVIPVDGERSEIQVAGTWHRRSDAAEAGPPADLEQHARGVLRGFLRSLARSIEESPSGSRGRPRPGRQPQAS